MHPRRGMILVLALAFGALAGKVWYDVTHVGPEENSPLFTALSDSGPNPTISKPSLPESRGILTVFVEPQRLNTKKEEPRLRPQNSLLFEGEYDLESLPTENDIELLSILSESEVSSSEVDKHFSPTSIAANN